MWGERSVDVDMAYSAGGLKEVGQWELEKTAKHGCIWWTGWLEQWGDLFIFIFHSLQSHLPSGNLSVLKHFCFSGMAVGITAPLTAAGQCPLGLELALKHLALPLGPVACVDILAGGFGCYFLAPVFSCKRPGT